MHGLRNDGWYMNGKYNTLTDSDGTHRLHIDASLVAPTLLNKDQEH